MPPVEHCVSSRVVIVDAVATSSCIFAVGTLPVRPKDKGQGVPSILYSFRGPKLTWSPFRLPDPGEVVQRIFFIDAPPTVVLLSTTRVYTVSLSSEFSFSVKPMAVAALKPGAFIGSSRLFDACSIAHISHSGLSHLIHVTTLCSNFQGFFVTKKEDVVQVPTKPVFIISFCAARVGFVGDDGSVTMFNLFKDSKPTSTLRKLPSLKGDIVNVNGSWDFATNSAFFTYHLRGPDSDFFVFRTEKIVFNTIDIGHRLVSPHRPLGATGDDLVFFCAGDIEKELLKLLDKYGVIIGSKVELADKPLGPYSEHYLARQRGVFFTSHAISDSMHRSSD